MLTVSFIIWLLMLQLRQISVKIRKLRKIDVHGSRSIKSLLGRTVKFNFLAIFQKNYHATCVWKRNFTFAMIRIPCKKNLTFRHQYLSRIRVFSPPCTHTSVPIHAHKGKSISISTLINQATKGRNSNYFQSTRDPPTLPLQTSKCTTTLQFLLSRGKRRDVW